MTREQRFKSECKRYLELTDMMSPLEKEKRSLKKSIDAYTGGENTVEGRYSATYCEVKGTIDLDALLAEHPEIDLERYRKAPTKRIQIKVLEG